MTDLSVVAETISKREREVLALIAEGFSNKQIAKKLYISLATVKRHVNNMSGKTKCRNRAHLAVLYVRHLEEKE